MGVPSGPPLTPAGGPRLPACALGIRKLDNTQSWKRCLEETGTRRQWRWESASRNGAEPKVSQSEVTIPGPECRMEGLDTPAPDSASTPTAYEIKTTRSAKVTQLFIHELGKGYKVGKLAHM